MQTFVTVLVCIMAIGAVLGLATLAFAFYMAWLQETGQNPFL